MLQKILKSATVRSVQRIIRQYGTIGDAGGAFGKKGTAQEEKFIHDHEVEVLEKLKESLKQEEAKKQKQQPKQFKEKKEDFKAPDFVPGAASGGALGGREAALENQWIRKHDAEKIAHLHEELEAKKHKK